MSLFRLLKKLLCLSPLHVPTNVQKNLHEYNVYMQIFLFFKQDFSLFYNFFLYFIIRYTVVSLSSLSEQLLLADGGDEFLEIEGLEISHVLEVPFVEGLLSWD